MADIKVANGKESAAFAVEDIPHETPMGYHIRQGGAKLSPKVWKELEERKKIYEYCPELSMIMDMKLNRERCEWDLGDGELTAAPPNSTSTTSSSTTNIAVGKRTEAPLAEETLAEKSPAADSPQRRHLKPAEKTPTEKRQVKETPAVEPPQRREPDMLTDNILYG